MATAVLCNRVDSKKYSFCKELGAGDTQYSRTCSATLTKCPAGHQGVACKTKDTNEDGYYCEQCSDYAYQPNEVTVDQKCRLRTNCEGANTRYEDRGSTIRDAICKCNPGYHVQGVDRWACVPNRRCGVGYGQGKYGQCEKCIDRNAYSDRNDVYQHCMPLRNCEKEKRCTIKRSNGTYNNVCSGYTVKDTSKCRESAPPDALPTSSSDQAATLPLIVGGAVLGAVLLIVLIMFLVLYLLWRRRRSHDATNPMTKEDFESLLERIVKRADGDEPYSRKIIAASFREIEDRIDKQTWRLAQELFREHMQPAMYEVIVEKYKGVKELKYAVNGYLQDWKEWKGETSQSVRHLFTSLHNIGREDIVYEICNKFRESYPEVVMDAESRMNNSVEKPVNITYGQFVKAKLCPCSNKSSKNYLQDPKETNETKDSLLTSDCKAKEAGISEEEVCMKKMSEETPAMTPEDAGAIYRERPCPSAPVIDDCGNVHIVIPNMNRTNSVPVQASS